MVKCVTNNVFKVICILSIFSSTAALAFELVCDLYVSGVLEQSSVVTTTQGQKISVADFESLKFFIEEKESPRYVIEVFDPSIPSRSYAEGVLITPKDELKWSLWNREIWIDLSCSLNAR